MEILEKACGNSGRRRVTALGKDTRLGSSGRRHTSSGGT